MVDFNRVGESVSWWSVVGGRCVGRGPVGGRPIGESMIGVLVDCCR